MLGLTIPMRRKLSSNIKSNILDRIRASFDDPNLGILYLRVACPNVTLFITIDESKQKYHIIICNANKH